MTRSLLGRFWSSAMRKALDKAIERVVLMDEENLPNQPTIFYLNHHTHFDGHLIWLMIFQIRRKQGLVWMERWDEYPFLGLLGALPFPKDQPKARVQTLHRTIALLNKHPDWDFYIFPEGIQHPPEEGIMAFSPKILHRLSRELPQYVFCPVAIRVTWWSGERPTLLMKIGTPHSKPDGQEAQRLQNLLDDLAKPRTGTVRKLMEKPIRCKMGFGWMRRFFRDYPK